MPKVRGPLLSGDARGRFGHGIIYRRGGVVTRYFKPRNPNTDAQKAVREAFKEFSMPGLTQEQADLLYAAILHLHDDSYSPLGHGHDHGSLTGLGDDDHEQYFNQTRGDARYLRSVPQQDHGGLAGLGDDDHEQYFNQQRGDERYKPENDRTYVKGLVYDFEMGVNQADAGMPAWTALNTGTWQTRVDELNHPGIHRIKSSGSMNSGSYKYYRSLTIMRFQGGEVLEMIVYLPSNTDILHRLGFHDSNAVATVPTDGAWFEITNGGGCVGKTADNGSVSTTANLYTLAVGTWYRLKLMISDARDLATFEVYASPGSTVLGSATLATNIPTGDSRQFGLTLVAGKTSAGLADIFDIDWLRFGVNKAISR